MIQRIQTLLLLVAVICFVAACFMPVGHITSHDTSHDTYYLITPWVLKESATPPTALAATNYRITPWVLKKDTLDGKIKYPTYFIGMLQVLLAIMSFIAIFLYKKRAMQSKFCIAAIIVNFILIITMLWVYPDHVFPKIVYLSGAETEYSLWTLLSIVPLICLYFANKFIIKDEKMVRAADRLR